MHLDRDLLDLLETVDEPTPEVDPSDLIARAERRRPPTFARWAAGILLTFGAAGAVYAAPGSPVPGWIETLAGRGPTTSAVIDGGTEPADISGIGVPLVASLSIELQPQASGTLTVLLTSENSVRVAAMNGSAVFDSQVRRLVVESAATPDYRIAIPRTAMRVDVLVGGRSVFRIEEGEIVTTAEPAAAGQYSFAMADIR